MRFIVERNPISTTRSSFFIAASHIFFTYSGIFFTFNCDFETTTISDFTPYSCVFISNS
jgi:hypothetical protein